MEELVIQTHDFEESKNQLKKFSEETTTDLDLKRVNSEKGVGEFLVDFLLGKGFDIKRNVTGSELNSLTADIQQHLININNMQRSFINEIGHVYTALESLDKDYIQAILIAVKSAQKANGEAKSAQADIKKTIEDQKKIIKVLQQFKDKLDKFKHILDIDKMWSDTQNQTKDIKNINAALNKQSKRITDLLTVKEIVDALEHISDVDKLWQDVQTANDTIASLDNSVKKLFSNQDTISKITGQKFIYAVDETKGIVDELVEKMNSVINTSSSMKQTIDDILSRIDKVESVSHLSDVDYMYDETQNLKVTVANLNEAKDSLIEENTKLSSHIEEIEKGFAKKMTIAYALAGGSICLVVIEFVLAMIGLI